MEVSVVKSVIFLLAYIFFYITLFSFKKTKKELNGVVSLCVTFVLTLWVNTMVAALINLIHIPISLLSMSVSYLIMGSVLYITQRKKEKQAYTWNSFDVIFFVLFFVLAILLGLKQHDYNLQIAYLTSDPAMHFRYALEIMETGVLNGKMFYAPLNNGLFISMLSPLLLPDQYYKIFILADIIMFALSGCIFYSVIREELKNRKQMVFGAVMAVGYMLGYPFNNKLFGFVYLGMSVTIIATILYVLILYQKDEINEKIAIVLLMLGCNAIVMCYMLFAPVVYIAILVVLIMKYKKQFISVQSFLKCLAIYLLPCILAIYYCYFNFFKLKEITISGAIAQNGGIYGTVYANFVFFLPLVIYMLIKFVKEKTHKELIVFFGGFVLFMIAMLYLVFKDQTSFYYFYKIHYPLWLIVFWITAIGILRLYKEQKEMLFSYGFVVLALVVCNVSGFDTKVVEKERAFGYSNRSDQFFSVGFEIYDYNSTNLQINLKYNSEKMKLFNHVARNMSDVDSVIPLFVNGNNYQDCYWYEDIARMNMEEYYAWTVGDAVVADKIFVDKEVEYAIVLYENPLYEQYKEQIDSMKKIYESGAGCIIKIE